LIIASGQCHESRGERKNNELGGVVLLVAGPVGAGEECALNALKNPCSCLPHA